MTDLACYRETQAASPDERLISCAPLVRRIAYYLMARMPPSVQVDDLIQSGMIGLLEASRNYDPAHGATFETYAGIRIRGAMIDEVRKCDWTPRTLRKKVREVSQAIAKVESEQGREARDSEVAQRLGIALEEYHRILGDAAGHKLLSLEDMSPSAQSSAERAVVNGDDPLAQLERERFKEALSATIGGLPEKERLVMAMYYDEELNLREIGVLMGVSEARVCQIHGQALMRIRARLGSSVEGASGDGKERVSRAS